MHYLVLLYADESAVPQLGTPEGDADMAAYAAFDELAGDAIVAGEALHANDRCRTIRHDGGRVQVTDGPFAETVEGLGGFFVLQAPSLDEALELARRIPAVTYGSVELRPMVEWTDRTAEVGSAGEGQARWLATLHGVEDGGETPGTAAWGEGAAAHAAFAAAAGDRVLAAGAVQPTTSATTVSVADGELLVTDGPYPETAEVVGGFYVLRGTDDEVLELAARIPTPRDGGVQLRPVMELDG